MSSYLTNQESSQGVALQLDVLVAERDTVQDTVYLNLYTQVVDKSCARSCKTGVKQLEHTNSQFTTLFEAF